VAHSEPNRRQLFHKSANARTSLRSKIDSPQAFYTQSAAARRALDIHAIDQSPKAIHGGWFQDCRDPPNVPLPVSVF